jgi:hypothetical protein
MLLFFPRLSPYRKDGISEVRKMQQIIKSAIACGFTRFQAYELYAKAVEIKKRKVFCELLKLAQGECSWSQIESLVRRYQLSKEQYQQLKRIHFSY